MLAFARNGRPHIDSGKVSYAVLSFGGFLSLSEKRLTSAPGFDTDTWPNMADATWGRSVHAYYGTTY